MTSNQHKYIAKFFPLMLCFLPLLLSACDLFGGNAPTTKPLVKAPASQQTYTIPEVGIADFDTLDPALAHDTASISAIQMMYTGLVQLDNKLEVEPQLAQSWQQSSDGMTWTFHLRAGLKFSDGSPLTSSDVAYSIDRALQPTTQSTVAPLYLGLLKDADKLLSGHISTLIGDSIQTPDVQTVVLVTRKKAAYFLAMLTNTCSYIVEKRLINQYGSHFTDHLTEGGGAGPFKVAQYTHRVGITFVPNTNYYRARPQLQKVSLAIYHSQDDAYTAYLHHQVDEASVPLSVLSSNQKPHDFHQQPQFWINYYAMNYLVKPFDNVKIRQAFALAIDKAAIAENVWKNTVIPTNHIVPSGMPDYNANLTGPYGKKNLTGNATQARQLLQEGLKEEGWSSVAQIPPITLTYASGISSFDQEVSMLIQMWQKVLNISVTPSAVNYNTLLDKVTAATNNPQGLQFWGLAWVGEYPDPQDWLSLQFGKGSPNNNMNYGENTSSDATQQQLIQQQLDSVDADTQASRRLQSYQQAEQQIVNDVGWLPIEQVTSTFLRTPTIVGIVDNAQGIVPPNDWATIYRVQ